ncbi:MAG TPA: hypothetical protein VEI94_10645, partial [Candidatus Bathyarchaeia archaeon]|nr:hypothetical protein [Candidatus Bathyarchaeia archaeon]
MIHAIRLTLVALLATCLPLAASPSMAASKTCLTGTDPSVASDATQIPAVRKAIDAACDCASFDGTSGKRHSNYVRCANTVILGEVTAGHLRSQCKATVKGYVSDSTCGANPKLHDVVCIKTTLPSGKVSCSIQPTTKGDGTTPNDKCASSPGKFDQVACPDFSDCIDAADTNGDLRIAAPGDSGACNPKFIPAILRLNELNANLAAGRDRIELLVIHSGNTSGIVVQQDVGSPKILATLPAVDVLAGDVIVIHMNPGASDAPASETTGTAQYPSATYSTNYDTAWDF